ncbi:MAG TPA: A24 family peptidase [Bryobacteraceae bacterium]|nr:A24 family peptidase [Bryobacteraceae bacterium]
MSLATWIALLLGSAATLDDLCRRSIANWIVLPALAGGLLYQTWTAGAAGLARSAGGAALGFVVYLFFYWVGAMGAGDIKLMAAFGALLGPSGILLAALLAAPVGGLIAAAALTWRRGERHVPYAPAIALGAWLAMLGRG